MNEYDYIKYIKNNPEYFQELKQQLLKEIESSVFATRFGMLYIEKNETMWKLQRCEYPFANVDGAPLEMQERKKKRKTKYKDSKYTVNDLINFEIAKDKEFIKSYIEILDKKEIPYAKKLKNFIT